MYKIPANTLFIGKSLIYVPECHSTNSLALEMSQQRSVLDGTVVITDNQTAGRGQRGNTWEAAQGKNLTFSIVLQPLFLAVKDQFFLNIFTSLAIQDFLSDKTSATVKIKWPNDILVNGKKICGILIENQIRGLQVSNTIAGIGLNINQSEFNIATATSLCVVLNKQFDLQLVFDELIGCIEARYMQLRKGSMATLKEEYLQQLYWQGEDHVFTSNGISFTGKINGIDEVGKLSIDTREGERYFDIKEISYVQ